jgi:murein L,D-transpeptidase YafK
MNKIRQFLLVILCIVSTYSQAEIEFMPAHIFQLDQKFTHHIAVVEKSTHSLYLFEQDNNLPKLIKKYSIATGKYKGNKFEQGDHRTPEGIYVMEEFYPSDFLMSKYGEYGKIYGAGAFTLNYPNEIDQREGKTGGGIWLHSTDDDSRISKGLDSRGCVVVNDRDLKEISQYIDLKHTPMIIVQEISFLPKDSWNKNRKEIVEVVDQWMSAWQEKRFNDYISLYSPDQFKDRKGNYNAYKQYKQAVFSRPDKPSINFSDISILNFKDYAVIQLTQDYKGEVIKDIGKKTLYLKKDKNYQWKIVAELWSKLDLTERNIAFIPSMRFFKQENN